MKKLLWFALGSVTTIFVLGVVDVMREDLTESGDLDLED